MSWYSVSSHFYTWDATCHGIQYRPTSIHGTRHVMVFSSVPILYMGRVMSWYSVASHFNTGDFILRNFDFVSSRKSLAKSVSLQTTFTPNPWLISAREENIENDPHKCLSNNETDFKLLYFLLKQVNEPIHYKLHWKFSLDSRRYFLQ
jgi:hypothetical protein